MVVFYESNRQTLLAGNGYPDSYGNVFKTGTLTMSSSSGENINIQLENGRVMGEDDNEHTLAISYSGPMTKKK
ncbi:hypothetical protein [Segatella oulorum]|uniref:hypothetical protein n=1 Tax=Segatella oulorum TaxID=28136 RepID=UPI0023F1D281|nr:hypothetical protein [Segatella oulorum]